MPRRTDTRERMLDAANSLFAEKGFLATSLADIVERSGTPRGSVYFHFPGGKDEIVAETTLRVSESMPALVRELAAATRTPADLVLAFFAHYSTLVEESAFRKGCPVATTALELAHDSALSEPLAGVFTGMRGAFAESFRDAGLTAAAASAAATLVVSGFEGSLIQARVARSCEPISTTGGEIATYLRACLAGDRATTGRPEAAATSG